MQKKLTVFILLSMLFVMLVVCGSKNPFTNTSIESSEMFNASYWSGVNSNQCNRANGEWKKFQKSVDNFGDVVYYIIVDCDRN